MAVTGGVGNLVKRVSQNLPRRKDGKSDPTNPANAARTLGDIGLSDLDALDNLEPDRLLDGFDETSVPRRAPFWDHQAIAALGFGALLGSIAGVPLGLYLHYAF